MKNKNQIKREHRIRRHARVRAKISGSSERPRVSVFRSNRHIFVQVIDDVSHKTLISGTVAGTGKSGRKGTKSALAKTIGGKVAQALKEKGITKVVFDAGGYAYHGRVKAVAEALREGGIAV